MFRKYIRWHIKRKEHFTENGRRGLFAEVSGRFRINVKTSGIAKLRPGRDERNIVVRGVQRGTVNESKRFKTSAFSFQNPPLHLVRHS